MTRKVAYCFKENVKEENKMQRKYTQSMLEILE